MGIEVEVDAAAVNKMVTDAILDSAIGKKEPITARRGGKVVDRIIEVIFLPFIFLIWAGFVTVYAIAHWVQHRQCFCSCTICTHQ